MAQYLPASMDRDSRKPASTQRQEDTEYRDNGSLCSRTVQTLSKGAAPLDCVRKFSVSGLVGGFSGMSTGMPVSGPGHRCNLSTLSQNDKL